MQLLLIFIGVSVHWVKQDLQKDPSLKQTAEQNTGASDFDLLLSARTFVPHLSSTFETNWAFNNIEVAKSLCEHGAFSKVSQKVNPGRLELSRLRRRLRFYLFSNDLWLSSCL